MTAHQHGPIDRLSSNGWIFSMTAHQHGPIETLLLLLNDGFLALSKRSAAFQHSSKLVVVNQTAQNSRPLLSIKGRPKYYGSSSISRSLLYWQQILLLQSQMSTSRTFNQMSTSTNLVFQEETSKLASKVHKSWISYFLPPKSMNLFLLLQQLVLEQLPR